MIFSRLINVLTAVMDAAYMSNIWIVVDRSDPVASSPTAELLLELATAKCEKPPVVLCLDSLHRYQAFRPSFRVNEQLMHLHELSLYGKKFDEPPITREVPTLYKPAEFNDWRPYHFRTPADWVCAKGKEQEFLEGDKRLPRKPEDQMVQTDENHAMMRCRDGRPLVTPQNKWLYHFRQYMYRYCRTLGSRGEWS